MAHDSDNLDTILALIKQIESALIGMKQLRGYLGNGPGLQMVEAIIEEMETNLAQVKRKLVQLPHHEKIVLMD